MFEVKNVEVIGMKQLVEGLRQAQGLHYTDSVQTHIEDPITMETAPYQFLLGDKDLKLIQGTLLSQKQKYPDDYDIRKFVMVYFDAKAGLDWWTSTLWQLNERYQAIVTDGCCFRKVAMSYYGIFWLRKYLHEQAQQRIWTTSEQQFMDWTTTLPYQELLAE